MSNQNLLPRGRLPERSRIVELATRYRLPAMYNAREFVQLGVVPLTLVSPGAHLVDVQGRRDILRYDAGAEPSGCLAGDLALEDQLHLLWTTQIKILTDDLLEEQTSMCWSIQHLR